MEVGGLVIDERPHLFKGQPHKFPDGYYQMVHPRWTKGHNLSQNATLVGHLEDVVVLLRLGYRLRMSPMVKTKTSSPTLIMAEDLALSVS